MGNDRYVNTHNFIIEFITEYRPCVYLRSSAIANFCSPCLKRRDFSTVCGPTLVGVCYPISYIVVTVTYFGYLLGPNELWVMTDT